MKRIMDKNRLRQLPLNIQKRLYELTGNAGDIYNFGREQIDNQVMTAFLIATREELEDFVKHARFNLEYAISWYDRCQEAFGTSQQKTVYHAYLRSPEWKRKRQIVLNRATRPCIPKSPKIHRVSDEYGRLIEYIDTPWKPLCELIKCTKNNTENHYWTYNHWTYDRTDKELIECPKTATEVHHWTYDQVGKERIGRHPEPSEDNDLIALCRECHSEIKAFKR